MQVLGLSPAHIFTSITLSEAARMRLEQRGLKGGRIPQTNAIFFSAAPGRAAAATFCYALVLLFVLLHTLLLEISIQALSPEPTV